MYYITIIDLFVGIANRCADEIPSKACSKMKENGACQYMFAEEKCAATCEYCKYSIIIVSI